MIKFTVQQHFMSAKHNSTIVLIYYDKTRLIYISYHLRPLKPLMLQLDYKKLLDILTSFPESHAILLIII